MPALSIVMPVYNAGPFLSEAVDSVLRQSRGDWELMLVDDGSTDNSAELGRAWCRRDPRIRLVSQANRGPAAARNRGLQETHGPWVAFLDADDTWLPNKLARQLDELRKRPAEMVFGQVERFDQHSGQLLPSRQAAGAACLQGAAGLHQMLGHNRVPLSTVIVRRDVLQAVGGFDERQWLRKVEDYHCWLRLLAAGRTLRLDPELCARYRVHAGNISRDRIDMKRRRLAALRDLRLPTAGAELHRQLKILELLTSLQRRRCGQLVRRLLGAGVRTPSAERRRRSGWSGCRRGTGADLSLDRT